MAKHWGLLLNLLISKFFFLVTDTLMSPSGYCNSALLDDHDADCK